jgi:peroxiredoxin
MRIGDSRRCRLAKCSLVAILTIVGCSQSEPPGEGDGQAVKSKPEVPATEQTISEQPAPSDSADSNSAKLVPEVADATGVVAPSLDVPTEPEVPKTVRATLPPAPLPASEAPLPLDRLPLTDLSMPKVVLSEQHAAMSKVKVGDAFPAFELPDTSGQQHSLTALYGPTLTLVVFWDHTQPTAIEELSDLSRYYLPRFAEKGFAVVAVNSGDAASKTAELSKSAGASFTVLVDEQGKAFAQVASDKLPRSYLLDSSGKVIWFDLEYSPTTRRDLAVAIRRTLGE